MDYPADQSGGVGGITQGLFVLIMPRSQFLLRISVQNKASTHSDCVQTALKYQEVK